MPEHRLIRMMAAALVAAIIVFSAIAPAHAAENLDDFELLARLVWLEARGESDEGQQAVVAVVLNRLADGSWGDTINKVVYASGQFSTARSIPRTTPTEKEYSNVRIALDVSVPLLPAWVMYFRADYDHRWNGYEHYTVIGGHWFGGFRQDRIAYERSTEASLIGDASEADSQSIYEVWSEE